VVHVILIGLLFFLLFALIVLLFVWRQISKFFAQRRSQQVLLMQSYHQRLKPIVSELLAKANDIDQESKYLTGGVEQNWSSQLVLACSELIVLGDSLTCIEHSLDEGNIRQSKENLLSSLKIAVKVSRELDFLRAKRRQLIELKNDTDIVRVEDKDLMQGREQTN
jgi:hypothetical protein